MVENSQTQIAFKRVCENATGQRVVWIPKNCSIKKGDWVKIQKIKSEEISQ